MEYLGHKVNQGILQVEAISKFQISSKKKEFMNVFVKPGIYRKRIEMFPPINPIEKNCGKSFCRMISSIMSSSVSSSPYFSRNLSSLLMLMMLEFMLLCFKNMMTTWIELFLRNKIYKMSIDVKFIQCFSCLFQCYFVSSSCICRSQFLRLHCIQCQIRIRNV